MEFDLKQSDDDVAPSVKTKRSHRWTAFWWSIRYGGKDTVLTMFAGSRAHAFLKAAGTVVDDGFHLISSRDVPVFQRKDVEKQEAQERQRLASLWRTIPDQPDARIAWAYRVWIKYLLDRLSRERVRCDAYYEAEAALVNRRKA
ncbi:hypothetical protein GURKE_00200 [Brevundimonas phage vB_BpoS-Gurke]|uniref:Uncharacterized protein n=1 Tax=Brevundimonas phage vB_BpoS-Gurke TaxID=2948599 RepID=A0A9E7N3W9_9CAUD|nr:hypothetical protein GURKE_00200 [Brevundimonas phage vB_BpoS-Gurke]